MKALESQQRIWKRELAFAQQKTFWLHFALEAQACAAFLRRARVGKKEISDIRQCLL